MHRKSAETNLCHFLILSVTARGAGNQFLRHLGFAESYSTKMGPHFRHDDVNYVIVHTSVFDLF